MGVLGLPGFSRPIHSFSLPCPSGWWKPYSFNILIDVFFRCCLLCARNPAGGWVHSRGPAHVTWRARQTASAAVGAGSLLTRVLVHCWAAGRGPCRGSQFRRTPGAACLQLSGSRLCQASWEALGARDKVSPGKGSGHPGMVWSAGTKHSAPAGPGEEHVEQSGLSQCVLLGRHRPPSQGNCPSPPETPTELRLKPTPRCKAPFPRNPHPCLAVYA